MSIAEQASAIQAACARERGLAVETYLPLPGSALDLILIPSGEFWMGTREDDPTHGPHQGPRHRVVIRQPFYLGKYPVTQAQWQAVMGENPAFFPGHPDHPMENVSWETIQAFCQQASSLTGRLVRLPSEAEWEYACRAGTETTYYFGDDAALLSHHGWFRDNSGMVSHPVGQFPPNAWGLYDMHGGIDEFVQDTWQPDHEGAPVDGSARVEPNPRTPEEERDWVCKKGGSWYDLAMYCESAHRGPYRRNLASEDHGFRVLVAV